MVFKLQKNVYVRTIERSVNRPSSFHRLPYSHAVVLLFLGRLLFLEVCNSCLVEKAESL